MQWITGGQIADPRPQEGALRIDGGAVTGRVARVPPLGKAPSLNARGLLLVPAFVDAHVHLTVGDPVRAARELLRRGVAGVVDLGMPERGLAKLVEQRPLRVRAAGPLFTAPGGYPTQTWGKDGHGLEVATADEARAAVARLAALQLRFVKLAFDPRHPLLSPDVAKAAADEAHKLGLKVVAHALEADSVKLALEAGADVLGHTPREPLPPETLEKLKGKWVISTLQAFGVDPSRLSALREAGMRIAYGTDLGNEDTEPGVDPRELALLTKAGVDALKAATIDSADFAGFKELGRLSVGSAASLIAVKDLEPASLARPAWVMNGGRIVV